MLKWSFNLSLCVNLCSDGSIEKKVIASVTEALKADPQFNDWNRLVEIFKNPSLQMISFTITEKVTHTTRLTSLTDSNRCLRWVK